jgi:hypothetical protein
MSKPEALYVITLIASSAPVPLPVLDQPHFGGLAAFRSRRVEDGRERFRIHIGYFTSMSDAETVLPLLRETYPWAFIGPAPQSGLGSLDDTGVARFKIVRPAAAASLPAPGPVPAPAPAVAAGSAAPTRVATPVKTATRTAPAVTPMPSVAPGPVSGATIVKFVSKRAAEARPAAAAAPPAFPSRGPLPPHRSRRRPCCR